ncbi:MAG: hypothetical protein LBV73_29150 [Paraburkholderia sp.]|jgi:hypothetical protein|nr:hypothetical protein [Paraburkholderia sp.]
MQKEVAWRGKLAGQRMQHKTTKNNIKVANPDHAPVRLERPICTAWRGFLAGLAAPCCFMRRTARCAESKYEAFCGIL